MSMSDPISDYLTRVRNAVRAEKKSVDIPYSKFKSAISDILKNAGFIQDYKLIEADNNKSFLSLRLKYNDGKSVIEGLKRISRPGIRRYVSSEDLPRVKNGLGVVVISTSKGLLTDKQARTMKIGGEVVCEIW